VKVAVALLALTSCAGCSGSTTRASTFMTPRATAACAMAPRSAGSRRAARCAARSEGGHRPRAAARSGAQRQAVHVEHAGAVRADGVRGHAGALRRRRSIESRDRAGRRLRPLQRGGPAVGRAMSSSSRAASDSRTPHGCG
jgi:hypothetical protein